MKAPHTRTIGAHLSQAYATTPVLKASRVRRRIVTGSRESLSAITRVESMSGRILVMSNDAADREAWDDLALDTRTRMAEYVEPFTTPISGSENGVKGWLVGTGNYLRVEDEVYLSTNEHVAAATQKMHMAHLPVRGSNYIRVTEPFTYWRQPIDFAMSRLNVPVMPSESSVLPLALFDDRYSPVSGELLFWVGYPGSYATRTQQVNEANRRYSWFGELESVAVPVASQELTTWPASFPAAYREDVHVAVGYPLRALQKQHEPLVEVPNPAGMSGSFLWDTKRMACLSTGKPWTPAEAKICGIVWATWLKPPAVIATRVEHLRECIASIKEG
jgi:hypothetical protein